ncbi:MAG: hypothetical protein WA040_14690 [Anaerolineae bacterium]
MIPRTIGSLILLLVLLSPTPQLAPSPRAFSRMNVNDVLNQLFVVDQPITERSPATKAFEVTYLDSDLATIQATLLFDLWLPTDLPANAQLVNVSQVHSVVEGIGVELRYEWPGGVMTIYQSQPSTPVHVYVQSDRSLQSVDINGHRAVYYDPGGPGGLGGASFQRILQWTDGKRWFEMRSTESLDELLKVASSLTPR